MRTALRTIAVLSGLALTASAALGTYRVHRGDTLATIARRNRTTIAAISAANGVTNPNRIRIGQLLTIPAANAPGLAMKPIVASTPIAPAGFYVVQRGDTLAGVAARFGVNPIALAAANGVVGNPLYVGARITVGVSPAGQPPVPAFPFMAQRTRVVAPGDSMRSIAGILGVSASGLAKANGLPTNARPAVGSRLVAAGTWVCPVTGAIGYMNDWGFPRPGPAWHEGIDLMAPRGRPVVAPVGGRLVRDPNPKGGNAFQLYGDDGLRYYGAHLDRYGAQGRVAAGTVIGYVGNTGDADGGATHLHFEIHPGGGAAVPPFPTVAFACR